MPLLLFLPHVTPPYYYCHMSQACALVDRSLGAVDAELADFLAGKSLEARIFALPWILSLACAIPPTSEGKKNSSKKM